MVMLSTPFCSKVLEGIIKNRIYAAYVEQIKPMRGHAVLEKVFFETLYQMLQLSSDEVHTMGRGQVRADEGKRVRVLKLMPLDVLRARYAKATGHPQDWAPTGLSREVDWDEVKVPF